MKKLALLLSLATVCLAQAQVPSASDATRYTFLMAGNKAGYESSTRNADGSLQVHFEFNDRGRGPITDERIVAGKDGIPTEVKSRGVDYFKARWKSSSHLSRAARAGKTFGRRPERSEWQGVLCEHLGHVRGDSTAGQGAAGRTRT